MKRFLIATTALTLLVAPIGGAFAQGYNNGRDDHRGNNAMMQRQDDNRGNMMGRDNGNRSWRKGQRFDSNDWNRYDRVDYRRNHLRRPPRGYEWRRVDNNYVMAAVATGLIASVILANH